MDAINSNFNHRVDRNKIETIYWLVAVKDSDHRPCKVFTSLALDIPLYLYPPFLSAFCRVLHCRVLPTEIGKLDRAESQAIR
jgi:hypothetical protein